MLAKCEISPLCEDTTHVTQNVIVIFALQISIDRCERKRDQTKRKPSFRACNEERRHTYDFIARLCGATLKGKGSSEIGSSPLKGFEGNCRPGGK